jgi:hypothetical protein
MLINSYVILLNLQFEIKKNNETNYTRWFFLESSTSLETKVAKQEALEQIVKDSMTI